MLVWAPGTWGTVMALLIWPLMSGMSPPLLWPVLALAFIFGCWICHRIGRRLGVSDYGGIVWDEWVGLWVCLAVLPAHWGWWLAGFAAFRLFDILKPWPIKALERRVPGGVGVMLDDLLAAGYAMAVLVGVQWVWPIA